ncbi:MAG: Tat pathway signal protein, partial [Methylibium sp.]|nr:Tat pathway signal protein [Methylibium sp.]
MADPTHAVGDVFNDLVAARIGRRELLGGSLGAAALGFLNGCGLTPGAQQGPLIGFDSIPVSRADTVVVPEG